MNQFGENHFGQMKPCQCDCRRKEEKQCPSRHRDKNQCQCGCKMQVVTKLIHARKSPVTK